MAEGELQPIIIKRIVKGHGHHGGSWKVAFADFATAMMAFFMLMWLMGSTNAEQKGGISEYFNNPSGVQGASPTPSATAVQGKGGSSTSMIQLGGSTELYKDPPPAKKDDSTEIDPATGKANAEAGSGPSAAETAEKKALESLLDELMQAIDQEEALKPFKDQILLDLTPEGLRIQIIDKESRSMFDLGSAELKDYSRAILQQLATVIVSVPNRLSISGHTDIKPYYRKNYSNWELSADRANAARRALIAGGVPESKIGRVVGLASSALLDPIAEDNPVNRRISIIVMNARTEAAIQQESGSFFGVQQEKETATP